MEVPTLVSAPSGGTERKLVDADIKGACDVGWPCLGGYD